jgi:hypothetical protein
MDRLFEFMSSNIIINLFGPLCCVMKFAFEPNFELKPFNPIFIVIIKKINKIEDSTTRPPK